MYGLFDFLLDFSSSSMLPTAANPNEKKNSRNLDRIFSQAKNKLIYGAEVLRWLDTVIIAT
jgi:hypothetical protein